MSKIKNQTEPEHLQHSHSHQETPTVLTIRTHSGLSGDMFLAGLLKITNTAPESLDSVLKSLLPELSGSLKLVIRQVHQINGWYAQVTLPHQHEHRRLADISALINDSKMSESARDLAVKTFTILAGAEAAVHGKTPDQVHFHEVGALDSILDICLTCELFTRLSPQRFVVSPLPLADGHIHCAHGILPTPAPAVLELLEGIPVCSFAGRGETITPTAVALLRSLGAEFGDWPHMNLERKAIVYGSRIFTNAPNGTLFAWGPLPLSQIKTHHH